MENYRFAFFKWKSKSLNTAVAERVQTPHIQPSSRRAIVSRTLVVSVACLLDRERRPVLIYL